MGRGPETQVVVRAVEATERAVRLEPCLDDRSLMAGGPLPNDPEALAAIEVLTRIRADAISHWTTGSLDEARTAAEDAVALAEEIDHPRLRAEAYVTLADVTSHEVQGEVARELYQKTIQWGGRASDEGLIARGWIGLLDVESFMRPAMPASEHRALSLAAHTAVETAGAPVRLRYVLSRISSVTSLRRKRFDEALDAARQSLELVTELEDPAARVFALQWLGVVHQQRGELPSAQRFLDDAMEAATALFGPAHPHVDVLRGDLCSLEVTRGDIERALQTCEKALDALEQVEHTREFQTAVAAGNWGFVLSEAGRVVEADVHLRRAASFFEAALGDAHPNTGRAWWWLARNLEAQGEEEAAQSFIERSVAAHLHSVGLDDPWSVITRSLRGKMQCEDQPDSRALDDFEGIEASLASATGVDAVHVAEAAGFYARCLFRLRRFEEARDVATRALEVLDAPGLALGPHEREPVRLTLADIEAELGHRTRAVDLATEARDATAPLGYPSGERLHEAAAAWLASYRP